MMEEIIARLGIDSTAFKAGLDESNAKISETGGFVDKLGAKLAGLVTVAALTNLAKQAIDYASDMNDAAEATRTGVEEYQVLAAVARESGASVQQLDQALIRSMLSGEKAAEGNKELGNAFATLNINVAQFNSLPTERKLETIGAAYVETGRSQEAYAAVTEILGTKSAPRLISALEEMGVKGFDAVSAKVRDAGLVLDELAAKDLDRLADQVSNFKVRALVLMDEVIAGANLMWRNLSGESLQEITMSDWDPALVKARADAIGQLISEGTINNVSKLFGGVSDQYFSTVEGQSRAFFGLLSGTNGQLEAQAAINQRINEILAQQNSKAAERATWAREIAETGARTLAIELSNADNAAALKMLEDGRALLRLKEMTDKDRLLILEEKHREAVERVHNMDLLGEGTAKEKEQIVKRVLDLERDIGSTKEKIAATEKKDAEERAAAEKRLGEDIKNTFAEIDAASTKAGEEREKKQKDLLELVREQVALETAISQQFANRYARSNEEISAGGGGSTLNRMVNEVDRITSDAQRNFDEAARLRAAASSGTRTDADRASLNAAADEAERRARALDSTRGSIQDRIDGAQGLTVEDRQLEELIEIKKSVADLKSA